MSRWTVGEWRSLDERRIEEAKKLIPHLIQYRR
jgi:hypothetical protein